MSFILDRFCSRDYIAWPPVALLIKFPLKLLYITILWHNVLLTNLTTPTASKGSPLGKLKLIFQFINN